MVRNWCNLYRAKYLNEETTYTEKITFKDPGRPSMVSQKLTAEIKIFMHTLRIAGYVISRRTVTAVVNAKLQSKFPGILLKTGGSIKLITKLSPKTLKSIE